MPTTKNDLERANRIDRESSRTWLTFNEHSSNVRAQGKRVTLKTLHTETLNIYEYIYINIKREMIEDEKIQFSPSSFFFFLPLPRSLPPTSYAGVLSTPYIVNSLYCFYLYPFLFIVKSLSTSVTVSQF